MYGIVLFSELHNSSHIYIIYIYIHSFRKLNHSRFEEQIILIRNITSDLCFTYLDQFLTLDAQDIPRFYYEKLIWICDGIECFACQAQSKNSYTPTLVLGYLRIPSTVSGEWKVRTTILDCSPCARAVFTYRRVDPPGTHAWHLVRVVGVVSHRDIMVVLSVSFKGRRFVVMCGMYPLCLRD